VAASTFLRSSRLASGITQGDLAARAKTSQPDISSIESGKRVPMSAYFVRPVIASSQSLGPVLTLPKLQSELPTRLRETQRCALSSTTRTVSPRQAASIA
jgi:transcriptional regulator with XRE-family HTH domain